MAFKDRLYEMPVAGTAMRVQDRYKADAGDQFAGAIGFFGFLSLFPLLLLALAGVGFVLADASEEQLANVAATIQGAIPGFSGALGGGETGVASALEGVIRNRGSVAGIGLITTLLSGLRVVNAAQTATLVIFGVDLLALSGLKRKLQQVVALVVLGLLAVGGVAASGLLGALDAMSLFGVMEVLAPALTWLGIYLLDVLLFLVAYRLFGTREGLSVRQLVPGALFAGLGWTLLKGFGATYVSEQVSRAGELYGALGGVIGLLLLMYLAGRLYVYGAELSAELAPRVAGADTTIVDAAEEASASGGTDEQESGPADPDTAEDPAPRRQPAPAPGPPLFSDTTRDRLAGMPEAENQGQGRKALGFALGVGALAAAIGVLRPWDTDR